VAAIFVSPRSHAGGVDVQHKCVVDLIASGEARINVQIAQSADGVPVAKIADGLLLLRIADGSSSSLRFDVCCLACVAFAWRLLLIVVGQDSGQHDDDIETPRRRMYGRRPVCCCCYRSFVAKCWSWCRVEDRKHHHHHHHSCDRSKMEVLHRRHHCRIGPYFLLLLHWCLPTFCPPALSSPHGPLPTATTTDWPERRPCTRRPVWCECFTVNSFRTGPCP
jgi:hypothetical protein